MGASGLCDALRARAFFFGLLADGHEIPEAARGCVPLGANPRGATVPPRDEGMSEGIAGEFAAATIRAPGLAFRGRAKTLYDI
jgi:hypothetical protein